MGNSPEAASSPPSQMGELGASRILPEKDGGR